MKLYSGHARPPRRAGGSPTWSSCSGWCSGCGSARRVHDARWRSRGPGRDLAGAGTSFRDTMTGAGDSSTTCRSSTTGSPRRSGRAAGVGHRVGTAGTDLVADRRAAGASCSGSPPRSCRSLIVVAFWFVASGCGSSGGRGAAQRFIDAAPTSTSSRCGRWPTSRCRAWPRVSDDPAGAWRRGDADVIHALAAARAAATAACAARGRRARRRPAMARSRARACPSYPPGTARITCGWTSRSSAGGRQRRGREAGGQPHA